MRVDTGRLRVVETIERPEPNPRRRRRPAPVADPAGVEADQPEQRTPGAYIHHQRKRKGMSLDQLAALTKIPRAQLELLEADRYEELPGMVFAKGFLRCCARSLDLDPDVVLGLLYERERDRLRARRREGSVATGSGSGSASPSVPRKRARGGSAQARAQAWLATWINRLPSARILMWLVVALLVALIVLIAFTLASAQAESMIRS
jgi:hypothetical protein